VNRDSALFGWLKKRDCKSRNALGMDKDTWNLRWSRRYFWADEKKGTVSYAKSETKKPSVVLFFADICSVDETGVVEIGGSVLGYAFVIACPPVRLTVCSESIEGRSAWIAGIRERMTWWQEQQRSWGYTIASTVSLPTKDATQHRMLCKRESLITDKRCIEDDRPVARSPIAQQGRTDRTWTRSSSGNLHLGADPSREPGTHCDYESSARQSQRDGYKGSEGDASRGSHEVNRRDFSRHQRSADVQPPCEDIMEYSVVEPIRITGDNDEGSSRSGRDCTVARAHSAQCAALCEASGLRKLADLLSSDEEEDD